MNDTYNSNKEIMSKFFTAALFSTALTAQAQAQETTALEQNKQSTETSVDATAPDDKSETTLTLNSGGIFALSSQKEQTEFYGDVTLGFNARAANKHGDYAQLSGIEANILNNQDYTALTIKFMIELGKQIGNGGTIVFKAGRESTEGGSVYDTAMSYYADSQNIGNFGNLTDRMVFGYTKGNNFIELGIIGCTDDGVYVLPNPKQASFWAKGGITLLQRSGVKFYVDGAARLGNGHKDLLASIGVTGNGFKARALGKYNFVERSGALCADLIKDLNKGWKLMAGMVFHQNKEVRLHCGVDKNDVQFSVEFAKQKDLPSTVNFTVATHLARSKTMKAR